MFFLAGKSQTRSMIIAGLRPKNMFWIRQALTNFSTRSARGVKYRLSLAPRAVLVPSLSSKFLADESETKHIPLTCRRREGRKWPELHYTGFIQPRFRIQISNI